MSADQLRDAAFYIRDRHGLDQDPFMLAVADMLDAIREWSAHEEPEYETALAVARAYLGGPS